MVAGINGVQMGAGATALARKPLSASSAARLPEKLTIAAFVAE